ncbi:MAG TPA: type IV secretion system protein [Anaeromyxobacter sp.]|nr:type IV secretion system protein [Anaeromyxobacter sp.]
MFRLFTPLFSEYDRLVASFVSEVSSRVILAITPVVTAAMTLWLLYWAVLVLRGSVREPVQDLLWRLVRSGAIVSLALSAGYYQGTVAELVRTAPEDLAAAILGDEAELYTVGPAGEVPLVIGQEATGPGALIDRAAGKGLAAAVEALHQGGVLTEDGVVFYVFGLLILLATVGLVSTGAATILVAKVVLGVLVALGPLFIAALLFDSTRRFFERWVAMVVTYGLLLVLFAALFSFTLGIFAHYVAQVRFDGTVNVGYAIAGALAITVVSMLVLREAKILAMGLAGGLSLPALLQRRLFAGGRARLVE